MKSIISLFLAAFAFPVFSQGQTPVDPDPNGILRKPIPDKLVALTFDDGPASHATIVAPILKSLGFGGSFYVCDFDSFHTRKDWYLTWRQMQSMDREGFEIGNHTKGHAGGALIGPFLDMEDELLANGVPKPTTIAWPVFQVNTATYPDLAKNGYTFGRGGHNRAYRPTVDNPFDIPCLYCGTVEEFVKCVRQANGGKIVVITFHGVPDMEHPAVGLEPAVFKEMMQYLADNHYKCIALRDLGEYIDPVKAAKLPPTANDFKETDPAVLLPEEKPYVPPVVTKSEPASAEKPAGSKAKDMLTFVFPPPAGSAIFGTKIIGYVPPATEVTKLAPTFTVPPAASAVPPSGTVRDFSSPQKYTVTAQDGSSRDYLVTVVKNAQPGIFIWNSDSAGPWSDGTKWTNNVATGAAPVAAGREDYVFHFDKPGNFAVTNDLGEGFMLNQLNSGVSALKVDGKTLAFTATRAPALQPRITQFASGGVTLAAPVNLADNLTVDVVRNAEVTLGGLVAGPGGLTKDGEGRLRITNVSNTYSGGTMINAGELYLYVANEGLGSGPITLNGDASLALEHVNGSNPLILNGGTIHAGNGFGDSWDGTITLNGNTNLTSYADFVLTAAMSGPGGFAHIGGLGAFGPSNSGTVTLAGTNTYSGATIARRGVLRVLKAASLYNGNAASWIPEKISVFPAATLVISAGGPGELTGAQVGILLKNLTAAINNNGLMNLAVLCLDTAKATAPVVIATDLADSMGPGGGAYFLKKSGTGTLAMTGNNTYTGKITLEGGTLGVASLNSVANGRPASSLGAPTTVENGEIFIGSGDGECALIYTGGGETTDRVMNLAGQKSTVTFDQSGRGLLKLTSDFVISGYGHDKTVALTGSTGGSGEIAGEIANPYDRAGKAVTALTKSGTGTWTLSGTNTYTGPTIVNGGTLSLANAGSLGEATEVTIASGATLELKFKGQMKVRSLILDGKVQPPGTYSSANAPEFIKGLGVLDLSPR
jgi:autotransporter-associated beta strand protein